MLLYVAACLLVLFLYYSLRPDAEPLLGAYSQPGKWYWFKYAGFYFLLMLRRWGLLPAQASGYGRKAHADLAALDGVQKLSDHQAAIDAAYFNGYNKDGYYFGAGIQRRPKGRVESLMFMRVPELGVLEWPFSPSTATEELTPDSYSAKGGLRFINVTPMKCWRVVFDGQLQRHDNRQQLAVRFDYQWTAEGDWFDFDTDMHPHPTCQAIAREPWSRQFFQGLEEAHQTHHEQFGVLKGKLFVEGLGERQVEMRSMRDHSYGLYRKWADFRRYILQYFAFDDGSFLALHLVSMTPTMTQLVTGFLTDKHGRNIPVYSCDKPLYSIGEDGRPPEEYELGVTAGGRTFNLRCRKVDMPVYYCGWEREAKLNVYMCRATIDDKIEGRGMCEFEYNNSGTVRWN